MGKSLIIKGADFSQNGISSSVAVQIEQGGVYLLSGSTQGNYLGTSDSSHLKRMRTVNTALIYIESGNQCTISGLQGVGSVPALRFDAAIYSAAENPSHSTYTHSLNGDSSNYFKFNTEGNNTFSFTAPYTGYYSFLFAGPNKTEEISPSNYNLTLIVL